MRKLAASAAIITATVLLAAGLASAHDPRPPEPDFGTCSEGDGAVIVNKASAPDLIAANLMKGALGDACIYAPGETLHDAASPIIVVGGPAAVPEEGLPAEAQRVGGADRYQTAKLIGKWAAARAAAEAADTDLLTACQSFVGLPLHSADAFSDDFWGDVYKTEVQASRDGWLRVCASSLPLYATRICDLLAAELEDATTRTDDDYHERVMDAVSQRISGSYCEEQ